ncbi:MAG TPA: ATP-binding cassette domain-containing protein [Terriglobia bacterium]|nr:ATP-binding cassette domain-containing protein [Terriglobia bacterium]
MPEKPSPWLVPAIELRHVSKYYDDLPVLKDISFTVRRGETKVILGGSGSGKSTILKLIIGLIKPDEGEIWVDGDEISKFTESQMMEVRRKIGMVFQEGALFDSLSVADNVGYRVHEQGILDEEEILAIVKKTLGFVELADAIDKFPSELSGGMRRRAAIARALVGNPKIMLYDEPTAGLDPLVARTINEQVIKLRDLEGVSSVFVTHRLRDAFTMANEYLTYKDGILYYTREEDDQVCLINTRLLMLREGQMIFDGADEEIRKSKDEYIQRFLTS